MTADATPEEVPFALLPRAQQRRAVLDAVARYMVAGHDPKLMRQAISAEFPGVGRSTIYRWMAEGIEHGAVAMRVQGMTAPPAGTLEMATVPGGTSARLNMIQPMQLALETIEGIVRYARGPDPEKPRNPKLALAAAASLVRCMDTAMGLHQALTQAKRLDEFHEAIIEAIQQESPAVAERVTMKLRALTTQLDM